MSQILGLKFRDSGQVYYFDSGPFVIGEGEDVIVSTDQGFGLGKVVVVRSDLPEDAPSEELKQIYRLATDEDRAKQEENTALALEAFQFCRECIRERELDMKLVDVEVFFDRSKIIFYFTAPNRIDFRELVKDLVKNYRTRIELRQIGVRHETQMIGAVGNCGQVCCCRRFLRKFAPVTIKMAKEQNLFLNPSKISGICGRLLCCLSYEQKNYEDFHRQCPKIGKKYYTEIGGVKVIRANIFSHTLSLIVDGGEEREVTLEEWKEMKPKRPDQVSPEQIQQAQQNARQGQSRGKGRDSHGRGRGRDRDAHGKDDSASSQSDSSRSRSDGGKGRGGKPSHRKDRDRSQKPRVKPEHAHLKPIQPSMENPESPDQTEGGGVFGITPEKGRGAGGDDKAQGQKQDSRPRGKDGRPSGDKKRKPRRRTKPKGERKPSSGGAGGSSNKPPRRRRKRKPKPQSSGGGESSS